MEALKEFKPKPRKKALRDLVTPGLKPPPPPPHSSAPRAPLLRALVVLDKPATSNLTPSMVPTLGS